MKSWVVSVFIGALMSNIYLYAAPPHQVPAKGHPINAEAKPTVCSIDERLKEPFVLEKMTNLAARLFIAASALAHEHSEIANSEAFQKFQPQYNSFGKGLRQLMQNIIEYEESSSSGPGFAQSITSAVTTFSASISMGASLDNAHGPPTSTPNQAASSALVGPTLGMSLHMGRPLSNELLNRFGGRNNLSVNEKKTIINEIEVSMDETSRSIGDLLNLSQENRRKLGRVMAEEIFNSLYIDNQVVVTKGKYDDFDKTTLKSELRYKPLDVIALLKSKNLAKPSEIKALEDFANLLKDIKQVNHEKTERELKQSLNSPAGLNANVQKVLDFHKAIEQLHTDLEGNPALKAATEKILSDSREAVQTIKTLCELRAFEGE